MLRTALIALLAFTLAGCAKVTLTTSCPASATGIGFALAGSTIGNTALSMLSMAQAGGMLAAARAGTATPTTSATMTYDYLPIFGADSGSLNCTMPPQMTTVVTSPPASIVH